MVWSYGPGEGWCCGSIGFKNDAGGYELRGPSFKGSNSPKTARFMGHGKENVSVFEGFFSWLSFLAINQALTTIVTNFVVLNSLSFFEKERARMECHREVLLYLDRDLAGINYKQKALRWSEKFTDKSQLYGKHKDLKDYLIGGNHHHQRQRPRLGRRF